MKTAIYIEDGVVQLVITPQNEFEKNALRSFESAGEVQAHIFTGAFYDCRGGWTRQTEYFHEWPSHNSDRSLILRSERTPKPEQPS